MDRMKKSGGKECIIFGNVKWKYKPEVKLIKALKR